MSDNSDSSTPASATQISRRSMLAALAAKGVEGGAGARWLAAGASLFGAGEASAQLGGPFPYVGLAVSLANQYVPNFFSSAPDVNISRTVTGPTFYYDTVNGNNNWPGTSHLQPKQTLPDYLSQQDALYLIAAGSVVTKPLQAPSSVSRCTVSVYDGNPGSATFGQEIPPLPNSPSVRAMNGETPGATERSTRYFTIAVAGNDLTTVSITSACVRNIFCDMLVRGAIFSGGTANGVYVSKTPNYNVAMRLEDCIFDGVILPASGRL